MPYLVAFALFQACTLGMFIVMMRRLLREQGAGWLAPLLAFPAVFWTLGLGQNAFLTAALFGGFTLMVDRRPVGAGILLGALCYKPHFGLLVPGALHRRAALGRICRAPRSLSPGWSASRLPCSAGRPGRPT